MSRRYRWYTLRGCAKAALLCAAIALACSPLLLLKGCGALPVIADKHVSAGCQMADGLTTWYALKHGAVEANGLLAGFSGPQILALKVIIAIIIWKFAADPGQATQDEQAVLAAGSVVGCGASLWNLRVIQKL